MTTLKIHALTTAAVLVAALAQPALAAPRTHHSQTNSTVQSGGRTGAYDAYAGGGVYDSYGAYVRGNGFGGYNGPNLPYPDRPWGDPDRD